MFLSTGCSLERVRAAAQQKQALVLPAFEPTLQGSAGVPVAERAAAAFFKSDLKALVDSSNLMQFKLLQFPRGHAPTDYPSFFALPAAAPPYAIRYTRFFEPWFLAAWPHLPWFDVHFRGYGFNKVVHIASLRYHNFSFWGHPAAWLVHRPHPDTRVRQLVVGQATDMNKHRKKLPKQALYMKVSGLWQAARRAMEAGTYVAALDEPHVRCQAALPWLQRPPQLVGTKVPKGVFS